MRNHDAVVDAEALVGGIEAGSTLPCHRPHHLLEAAIAAYPADNQDLVRAHMSHGPLGRLHQGREDGLLQGEAEVCGLVQRRHQLQGGEDTGEGHVHAFDSVWKIDQILPATGH